MDAGNFFESGSKKYKESTFTVCFLSKNINSQAAITPLKARKDRLYVTPLASDTTTGTMQTSKSPRALLLRLTKRGSTSLDVTSGVIWKQLLKLAIPVLLSSAFQQMYSLTNTWVIGRFAGKSAFAAIQATAALSDLVVGFSVGLGVGCGVVVSQYFGAHDNKRLGHAVHTAMGIAIAFGAICSVVGVLMSATILHTMRTPAEIFEESHLFSCIYLGSLLFSVVFNTGSALQRAVGDTTTPSLIVAGSCLVNIVFDLIFVAGLHLEVLGAALATSCTLATGALVTLFALTHAQGPWRVEIKKIRIEKKMCFLMIKTGLPLAIQSSVYSFSNIIAQSSINDFGTSTVAAWGLSGRLDAIIWMVSEALSSSVTTFSAQNFGAKNYNRMRAGLKTSLLLTAIAIGSASLIVIGLSYPLANFFVQDTQIAALTSHIIWFIGPFYVCFSLMSNIGGTIRGAGESLRPMLITILGTCVFRMIWLLLIVPQHHVLEMVLVSYPVTWSLTLVLFLVYYRFGHWLTHANEHQAERLAA